MSDSYDELHSLFQSGELSPQKWHQWQEFYASKEALNTEPVQCADTLQHKECRMSDTQNEYTDTQPLTLFESAVVWVTEPMHIGIAVIALIFFEPLIW